MAVGVQVVAVETVDLEYKVVAVEAVDIEVVVEDGRRHYCRQTRSRRWANLRQCLKKTDEKNQS